uniref:Metalloendopeptidase n=1 Tax=Pelusios castaneus TaxID=367368 RepID=A0A8C8VHG2_9SAUR
QGYWNKSFMERERNSIIDDMYRWPLLIPYVLEDSLEMNAKGVILKAFEQYRLKTCIDFKPWEGEKNYISVFKGSGCWSSVGNRQQGKQQLSIGANCDRIGTIQHEFLHALGFWHEQSRSDRDDYVTIMRDRIQSGKENNFNKYDDKTSSSLNVPYDYTSVMHYSKTAFMNGTEPTIVTNIPDFMDVIGQRMDFSDYDLQKLNRLYNCSSSLTFMDTCSFELENVCGMIQSSEDNSDWQRVSQVSAGPHTDHTNMGDCKDTGYFMHFNTSGGSNGSTAILESRILYPKRGFQCLQFYYYNSGNESDQLNILVREYSLDNSNGSIRLIERIQGSSSYFWDRPSKVGSPANFTNGTQFMRGPSRGTSGFLTHQRLRGLNFIKEDGVFILLTMEDISHLISTQPNFTTTVPTTGPTSTPDFCKNDTCANDGICILVDEKPVCRCTAGDDWWYMGEKCEKRGSTSENIIIAVSSTIAVFVFMLLVTIISTCCMRKKYHQKMKRNKEAWVLENVSIVSSVKRFRYFLNQAFSQNSCVLSG